MSTFVSFCLAAATLSGIFSDHMVLQRERKVPIWGTATPGEQITVSFADQIKKTTAGADGNWRVDLDPLTVSAQGRDLVVATDGSQATQTIHDVLVGEVWLASGQSNMAFRFNNGNPRSKEKCGALVAQVTNRPRIRYARVKLRAADEVTREVSVDWNVVTPHFLTHGGPSAVATYFALELEPALDMPIGIVGCAWGGTNIDAWIPHTEETAREAMAPRRPNCRPAAIYRGTVAALTPFAVRGLIWYQGEADATQPEKYAARMKRLYDDWGKVFENQGWPMLFVQLAPFSYKESVPPRRMVDLQLAQTKFAASEPNAYMTTVGDLGNLDDIHPNDKRPVGLRLAALALNHVYGWTQVRADSPIATSAQLLQNGEVKISFEHGEGLYLYNENRSLSLDIELGGADGNWHSGKVVNADKEGRLEKGVLIIVAKDVAEPKKVRYLFRSPWYGALRNSSTLPAGPFELEISQ